VIELTTRNVIVIVEPLDTLAGILTSSMVAVGVCAGAGETVGSTAGTTVGVAVGVAVGVVGVVGTTGAAVGTAVGAALGVADADAEAEVDAACDVLPAAWLLLVDDVQPAIDNEATTISAMTAINFCVIFSPTSRCTSACAYSSFHRGSASALF
jgi:hypothetical protein